MYCILMKLFDLSPPVYSITTQCLNEWKWWLSPDPPENYYLTVQKLSFFLLNCHFLTVKWQFSGGSGYYHSKMIYGQKKMLFSRIWTLCQSSTKLSMLLTILIIRNAWLNHVSRCKNPFLSVREFVCVSCLFEIPPSALDTWMWSEFSPLDLVN